MSNSETMLDHARGLLTGEAGRQLPALANRAAAEAGVPQEARAPHGARRFAGMTIADRRDHVARWALQLVADFGGPVASSVVLGLVEETTRAIKAEAAKRAAQAPAQRATSAQEAAARRSPYVVACARGCGHWVPARGPQAVVVVTSGCRASQGNAHRALVAARRAADK